MREVSETANLRTWQRLEEIARQAVRRLPLTEWEEQFLD